MNAIIYLVRSSKKDIDDLNESLRSISDNLIPFLNKVDVIIFHESDLDKSLIETDLTLIFEELRFECPNYPEDVKRRIPDYFPHPTHGSGPVAWGHPGFSMGYRHMCRFFSGEMYRNKLLRKYEYYLRLDTDSLILTPLKYDLFEWARLNGCMYGYIKQAVQYDNPKVVTGLRGFVRSWWFNKECNKGKFAKFIEKIRKKVAFRIPEGKMFYTNFELGQVKWFLNSGYMDFYDAIDANGGIYTSRWGDAPIKYLGVSLLMPKKNIVPVSGFRYQHGAIYDT